MKAPDIIYTDGMNTCATRPVFSNIDSNIKYIRADLTELTWEDIRVICEIESDLWEEVCQGEKEDSMQPYYTEVLQRFLESKKKNYD